MTNYSSLDVASQQNFELTILIRFQLIRFKLKLLFPKIFFRKSYFLYFFHNLKEIEGSEGWCDRSQ